MQNYHNGFERPLSRHWYICKRMFFHVCQMGLKNLNVFNTVFAAKYKAQKCWFTDWKQDAKRNGGCFSWIDVKKIFWFTKNIEIWNLEMLYLHELENKTSYNKKKARKPWEGLYWAAEHWDVTSDAEQDLTLETFKISCEISNLGYILLVHLSVFLFFHWADIPPLISEW